MTRLVTKSAEMRSLWLLIVFPLALAAAPGTFRVATYNVNNYLLTPVDNRPLKSSESRQKIRESIRVIRPDVLALQELGGERALVDLQSGLRSEGLDLPHGELITAFDTNIQVGVLSRFPIVARRPHTNESYLLFGKRLQAKRGFLEVDLKVSPTYSFTLITTHLKSKLATPEADEEEMREQEALLLRGNIEARLQANPRANLIVLGDLNTSKDTRAFRSILGRGRRALIDTRPAEQNGDTLPHPNPRYDPPRITWTHHYGKEDAYSRIDYILLSAGMAKEWRPEGTFIPRVANWGIASDHRPLVAEFLAEDQ